nr:unnamed protein product [Callosobruchus analis]
MIRCYYRNAHAIIFMYDITNRATFENLKRWIDESNQNCLDDVPRILVGNKCDGPSLVPTNEAQHFADQYAMPVSTLTTLRCKHECKLLIYKHKHFW